MVSLLEQYESETQKTNEFTDESNPLRSGYIQAALNLNENEEIFKTHRVQINILDRSIDQFEKCSGQMAILFRPKTIRLFHIENRTDETLESPEPINRFYLDTTGRHLLVATENQELYYYSRQSKKFKSISRLRGQLVTAVAWNKTSTDKTIESILLGTNKGGLFELSINTSNEGILSPNVESYCKQIYNFGKEVGSITGIEILHFKKENKYSTPNFENVYNVVVATNSCLFEFIGNDSNTAVQPVPVGLASSATNLIANQSNNPIFTSIFSYYESKTPNELANFTQMPRGVGQLQLRSSTRTRKKMLAWIHGGGVLVYEFDPFSLAKFLAANFHNESSKRLISENSFQNLRFPLLKNDDPDEQPIGMCLTEFHAAFFFKSQVRIVCLLNEELVFNQKLDLKSLGGQIAGIWMDSLNGDFGSYTRKSIVKYEANKESRRIWKIYLAKNEFEQAKSFCKDNPANLNLVLTKQAEYLFNNKKYAESAICYAQTQNSFEEICLKYLELSDFTALRTFLTNKLNNFDVEKEITQTTVIISYIIEIFLSQLSDLMHEKSFDDYDCLHNEFCRFLESNKVKQCLRESKDAIYKIFASHGNVSDMIYFAEVMRDYAQIIAHYIQEENYRKALEALAKQNNRETFYKYSPLFFELLPKEVVELWIKVGNLLNPGKLLPSLASCALNDEQITEAMRYLEYCSNKLNSEDPAVHNNLLILYLKHAPSRLLDYVKSRKDQRPVYFDELMIARLCTTTTVGSAAERVALNESCVYLYSRMGWFEEAVDLALTVNVDLARDVAQSVKADDFSNEAHLDELKKLLWLRIARHVIEKENDVNKAMNFLQDMTESIAIEDVLPYFPEFVTIDQFKDAIRTSLANYTDRINSLKDNIEQAAKSAQLIRRDIQAIKQKSMTVNTSDQCSKCRFRLMSRRFYIFPCSHKFHADCLYVTSLPYLLPAKQKRIDELQKLLQDIQTIPVISPSTASANAAVNQHFSKMSSKLAQPPQTYSNEEIFRLKSELDELLANECPWCGERILRSIDEPFFDPLNYEAIYQSWL